MRAGTLVLMLLIWYPDTLTSGRPGTLMLKPVCYPGTLIPWYPDTLPDHPSGTLILGYLDILVPWELGLELELIPWPSGILIL